VRPSPPPRLWPCLCLSLLLAAAACSTTHAVRPLGRGNAAVGASLGGPLVQVAGVDIASPILTVEGSYGLRDDLEVTANADLTAAVYGDLHLEPGVAYHPLVRDAGPVPTLTVAGSVHFLTSFSDTLVAPQVTLAAAWRIRRRHLLYVGLDSALASTAPSRPVFGPLVGGEWRVGRFGLTLEAKWLAPNYDVGPTAPTWLSPDNHGYLNILVGVTRYIGDVR
jgi:hypothetical protein